MATRPELHIAVAKTKSKASDYNDNFEMMMDYVDDSIQESKDYVDDYMPSISSSTNGKVLTNNGTEASWSYSILETIYPIGSIYIGTMETCPLASLFGSWSKVSEGRVLWGSDSSHSAGNTIAAGLPNITAGSFYFEGGTVGNHGAIRTPKTGNGSDGSSGVCSDSLQFNASWSNSIYGNSTTVQPPAYVVNIWERTA